MATMNMIQTLNSAMDVMMTRDQNVLVFGEDVGYFGGVFRATEGLQKKYGLERCFDTPIGEAGIVGVAVFPDDGGEPAELIDVADARLLEAKRVLYRERARPARRAAA